jgi:uncharacterized protein (TIGR01777 family)
MKVVLAGGSGQVGNILAAHFANKAHEVVNFSRNSTLQQKNVRTVAWDAKTLGDWTTDLEGADILINLAGRNVNCRYNLANRRLIMDSRVESTRVLAQAIAQTKRPPRLWLQSSTATIYSHRYDAPNDELTGIVGGSEPNAPDTWKFSIEVADAWEREFDARDLPQTRKVKLRTAMVMSPDRRGVFDVLSGLVRKGLGGRAGDGRQFVSWIHDLDFLGAIDWLIAHTELDGAINLCSPNPLPNSEFMRAIRQAWGISFGLPSAKWMLEVGAVFLRTETELILKSRRVVPTRLLQSGFKFQFPEWPEAARDLCNRWKTLPA